MKKIVVVFCILLSGPAAADQFCEPFLAEAKSMNADTPRAIDEITELVTVRVNCELKSITYVKRVLVPGDALAPGMAERKQRQHTQLHCNKSGLTTVAQWTAIDVLYDVDFKYVITLTTSPENCDPLAE